ncbi:sugar transferase [Halobacillus salinarum]|uniref:Sugar transferase n=1 Tax=Halobacillus salinarum TaxID=2932257 RepID=A0ABY4EP55_9BACI|nr:sugar transferase [Halobacillus salinarum]UOQ45419.1 sugar transferase [Halobacillus salinarum]
MYENSQGHVEKIMMALVDVGVVQSGYFIVLQIVKILFPFNHVHPFHPGWLSISSLSCLLSFYLFNLYGDVKRTSAKQVLYNVPLAMICFLFMTFILSIFLSNTHFTKAFLLSSFLVQTLLILAVRLSQWTLYMKLYGRKRVILIGNGSAVEESIARKFRKHSKGWFEFNGFLPIEEMESIEKYNEIDVFVVSPHLERKFIDQIIRSCIHHRKEVLLVPQSVDLFAGNVKVQQVDDLLVYSVKPPGLTRSEEIGKRLFDVVISTTLLLVISPVFFLLFALVPLTSKGPALYKQERLGLNGHPYLVYKFRSMVDGAENSTGPVLAKEKDPRITKLGSIMRTLRLDELPQFINVIKGDMSLIGPRPEREHFINQYAEELPDYLHRLNVKPGLTGLAQVLANYSTSAEDKLRYDLIYVKNYTFLMDLQIFMQTIRVVLQREQSQGIKSQSQTRKSLKPLEKIN